MRGYRIMAHKLALSPLQNRIMWTLEEAGEETVGTVRATVHTEDDETLQREIDALERLMFVQRSTQNGQPSLALTPRGRQALTT